MGGWVDASFFFQYSCCSKHHSLSTHPPTYPFLQAGLFNPWDRALYLSVKHSRPFLSGENFQRPYQGFWQVRPPTHTTHDVYQLIFFPSTPPIMSGTYSNRPRLPPHLPLQQAILQRTLFTGLYFPLDDVFI